MRRGRASEPEEIRAGRLAVAVVGVIGVIIALIAGSTFNVQILTGLAFAVAASANFPALLLSLTWRRLTTTGTVIGILTGLISSIVLIILSPQVWSGPPTAAPFPLGNPANVTVPLGFPARILGSLLFGRGAVAEASFDEVRVRSTTGIGSERASSPAEPQAPSRPLANTVSS
jgi:cation/acetate symporter